MILGLLGMSRWTCLFIWIWSKPERLQQWRDSLFRSQKTLFSSPRAENSLFSTLELENRLFSPPRTRKQTYLITKQWIYSFCLEIQILYLCRKILFTKRVYETLQKCLWNTFSFFSTHSTWCYEAVNPWRPKSVSELGVCTQKWKNEIG